MKHSLNAANIFPILFGLENNTMNAAMYADQNKTAIINSLAFVSSVRRVISG